MKTIEENRTRTNPVEGWKNRELKKLNERLKKEQQPKPFDLNSLFLKK